MVERKFKPMIFSAKLVELINWKYIDVVDNMLDAGESPKKVHTWIVGQGFSISHPLVYEYAKLRKQAIADGINVRKMIVPAIKRVPVLNGENKIKLNNGFSPFERRQNLAISELEIMDKIIQAGYQTVLEKITENKISISTMMDAIRFKNTLTEGTHNNLTDYGIEYLKRLEQGKYQVIMEVLINFIPEDSREKALEAIEKAEDEYYKGTDFYEEYLKSKEGE
jgi:hypothetical protein